MSAHSVKQISLVRMRAFSSGNGEERLVLHLVVQYLSQELQSTPVIVSGTGFSLPLFKNIFSSNVTKADKIDWDSTGNFFDGTVQ